jgi:hypothetical protein
MNIVSLPAIAENDDKNKAKQETVKPEDATLSPEELRAYETKCALVDPLELVENPGEYMDRYIVMEGIFDKYTTLGLDYEPAMRSSKDYISFLIRRPDVKRAKYVIPLSELKLIIARKVAEKYTNLESGDTVKIYGQVFAKALNDPWVEVDHLKADKKDITAQPVTEDDKDAANMDEE